MTNPVCCARLNKPGPWPGDNEPCRKPGKVERDGKWWCGIHDPARAQARRDKDKAALQEFRDAAQRSTAKFNARMAIADAAIAWRRGGFSATMSQDLLRAVRKWEELPE